MLLHQHHSRVCRKQRISYAHNSQAQRVFKTAPLYAVTNPEPTATPELLALFTTFFESLWEPKHSVCIKPRYRVKFLLD